MTKDARSGATDPVSEIVAEMLARHGITERQQNSFIESALELSYGQARRRKSGDRPWTVAEIKKLADHFREPLSFVLAALAGEPGKPASLSLETGAVDCLIWIGPRAINDPPGPLVARQDATGKWKAMHVAAAGAQPSYEVTRVIFEVPGPKRIAVLDDDQDAAESIADFLCKKGLDAKPFHEPGDFLRAAKGFDGFIFDWLLGDKTAAHLLEKVREYSTSAPLLILTGQIESGAADENDLVKAGAMHRALVFEKPTRPIAIFNALQVGFASARQP